MSAWKEAKKTSTKGIWKPRRILKKQKEIEVGRKAEIDRILPKGFSNKE